MRVIRAPARDTSEARWATVENWEGGLTGAGSDNPMCATALSTEHEPSTGAGLRRLCGAPHVPDPAEEVALVAQRQTRSAAARASGTDCRWRTLRTATARPRLSSSRTSGGAVSFSSRPTRATLSSSAFSPVSTIAAEHSPGAARCRRRSRPLPRWGRGRVEEVEIVDVRAELEKLVLLRRNCADGSRLAPQLTPDQRLVLACQVGLQMGRAEFCTVRMVAGEVPQGGTTREGAAGAR